MPWLLYSDALATDVIKGTDVAMDVQFKRSNGTVRVRCPVV